MNQKLDNQFQANKELWDSRVATHTKAELYNLDGFKRGETSLNSIELNELGDVNGKSILHVQCHFGQDSLSWTRMGAKVTGSDISTEAINQARELNNELELDATFVVSNTYELPNKLEGEFDIVFMSYGVIGWLPDMNKLAEIVNHFLKVGGKFYMVEFHPIVWTFDDNFESMIYPYNNSGVLEFDTTTTYADKNHVSSAKKEYNWNHGIGEVVTAFASTGMKLNFLNEHDFSPYNVFPYMIEVENGYQIEGFDGIIPLVYSMMWEKG